MASPAVGASFTDTSGWHGTTSRTTTAGLTTTHATALICLFIGFNKSGSLATVSTVTSTSGLVFTKRWKSSETSSDHDSVELWTAPASSTLTGENFTVTADVSVNAGIIVAVEISGLFSTATPFDTNVGLPFSNTAAGSGNPVVTYSTSLADDLLLFTQAGNKSGAGTGVTGFTTISNTTNGAGAGAFFGMSVCWKQVSATQSSVATSGQAGNISASAVAVIDAMTSDNNGGGGGGGSGNTKRLFPGPNAVRMFPINSRRTFPHT